MKKLIVVLFFAILPSSIFAIGGLGFQLGQNTFSVKESYPETGISGVTLMNGAFSGSDGLSLGAYLYIDLIPFFDVEVEVNAQGSLYDIEFQNNFGPMPKLGFAWASGNTYTTVRKKIIGLSIPFLAGAQLHAGAGFNTHSTVPVADVELVTSLLGGNLSGGDPGNLKQALKEYLEDDDNRVEAEGFHIQTGLQFNVLMLDAFLLYRHTFVEEVVPEAKSFGGVKFRLGFGI